MKLFNFTYLVILITLVFSKSIDTNDINNTILIKRDHDTCDPKGFSNINRQYAVSFYNQPDGSLGTLYDCEVKYDGSTIKCKVDVPLAPDDSVTFKVKRWTAYNCTRDLCSSGNAQRKSYIFDKNGKIRGNSKNLKVNVGDHFCYRYIYGKKKCDVNYEILSMKYTMFGGF